MRTSWVAGAVLAVAAMVWADARPGVVRSKAGVVYDGVVDERGDSIVVTVRGIDTTLTPDEVTSITYGTFEERWTADYAKLAKTDAPGRVVAARRAFDERRYDLAERALREAQAIDPNSAEAAELLRSTLSQLKLDRAQGAPPPNAVAAGGAAVSVRPPNQWVTLSPDEINRVKQLETRESETKMRFSFANNVLKKFYDATPRMASEFPTFNDFRSAPSVVQASRIIKEGSKELVKDVRVVNDPEIIAEFRRDVMPLVLQGCATSQCHGGGTAAASKFALISPAGDAGTLYTNFYVLQSSKTKVQGVAKPAAEVGGNTIMPDVAYVIDRMRPETSLLLQYGLPDQYAELKHPRVRGYNGIYARGRDDAKYAAVLRFIQGLNPVQPDYGFEFQLQRSATPGPATRPQE